MEIVSKQNLVRIWNRIKAYISNAISECASGEDILNLQQQIDAITSSTDVRDVVGTFQELEEYDTSVLYNNDIVKVLTDETHNNSISYYRWVLNDGSDSDVVGLWLFVGSQGPFYTKSESDSKYVQKEEGKGLSSNDYTDEEKEKLAGIEEGAQANVQVDWNQHNITSSEYIKNKPEIVKGLAEGSIRGINADEESSEYHLGKNAVAFGENTNADGESSFATGIGSKAEKDGSVASGYQSYALGNYSQADGYNTAANGDGSHTEGNNTIANNISEHAQGQYNVSHTNNSLEFGNGGKTLFSIGNGTASQSLEFENSKNAVEVMQNGDMYVQGIGGYNGKNYDTAETLQDIVNKQSDWNQNDENAPDYIKNRICSEETIVIAKGTFDENSSINVYSNDFVIPIVGNTYKITVKATGDYIYHTVQPASSDGTLYIGYNIPEGSAYGGGTFSYNPNGISGAPNGEKFHFTMSGNPTKLTPGTDLEITLEIVNKIPEKFLYQADWNQNDDTKLDYIKNRICYDVENVITDFDVTSGSMIIDMEIPEAGVVYNVIVDGVESTGTFQQQPTVYNMIIYVDGASHGNVYYNTQDNKGHWNGDTNLSHIKIYKSDAHKLEEKYIPDTIARKSYVDNADNNLQQQIDTITSSTDVRDIVGTYADLQEYDTSILFDNDVVKVLVDESHDDKISYYRWVIGATSSWNYIGSQGPFYTKSESDLKYAEKLDVSPLANTGSTLDSSKFNIPSTQNFSIPSNPGYAEFNGQFTASSSGTMTTTGVTWIGDTNVTAGGIYQFSICNGYGIIIKVH